MSDIRPEGDLKSKHNWERTFTNTCAGNDTQKKFSIFICKNCNATFYHFYDLIPSIYQAIKEAGISTECGNKS
jgi:hypothetical protein